MLQNIYEPKELLIKPERITQKIEKSEENDPNIQINIQYKYLNHKYVPQISISYLFRYNI